MLKIWCPNLNWKALKLSLLFSALPSVSFSFSSTHHDLVFLVSSDTCREMTSLCSSPFFSHMDVLVSFRLLSRCTTLWLRDRSESVIAVSKWWWMMCRALDSWLGLWDCSQQGTRTQIHRYTNALLSIIHIWSHTANSFITPKRAEGTHELNKGVFAQPEFLIWAKENELSCSDNFPTWERRKSGRKEMIGCLYCN